MGAGWLISGLSTITRGPKNIASDGVVDGVWIAESDALYLDGQRLVAISETGIGAVQILFDGITPRSLVEALIHSSQMIKVSLTTRMCKVTNKIKPTYAALRRRPDDSGGISDVRRKRATPPK